MRSFVISIALTIAAVAVVAQQPAAQTAPPEIKTYTSAVDVQALIAQKKAAPLLAAAPYSVNMEYRATVGPAAVHEREAEIFYIIEGTATLVTGGKLVNETRSNPTNLSGTAVEGGSSRTVSKGDFILVPEGTPHWFSKIGGNGVLIDMSIHVPRPVPSFAELEKLVPPSK
ncbi:MAG TPA: cupin domain-containing protein [Candidatus Acidoferrales bacterium]